MVAAVCVGLGVLAAFLVLRPPSATAQEVEEELSEPATEGQLLAA